MNWQEYFVAYEDGHIGALYFCIKKAIHFASQRTYLFYVHTNNGKSLKFEQIAVLGFIT